MVHFKKICFIIVSVLLGLFLILFCYIQFHGALQSPEPADLQTQGRQNPFLASGETEVSAHRLGAGKFPEDTLMAAQALMDEMSQGLYRTDIIETDLRLTKDKQLILLHDKTLDRTTDSVTVFGVENAKPEDYTLAELQQLNFGAGFTDENGESPYSALHGDDVPAELRVLTLNQLLDFLTAKGSFKYVLEIKDSGDRGIEAMDILAETVMAYGLSESTLLSSFHSEVLRHADEAYPQLHRHASLSEVAAFYVDFLLNREVTPEAYAYDVFVIPPRYGPLLYGEGLGQKISILNLTSQGLINRAHRCGIAVYYWTINDAGTCRRLVNRGADCIITDYPDLVPKS